jgi:hypothetical protein
MTPTDQKNQQVMVVLKSGRKTGQDIGLSIIEEGEEPEEEVVSQGSSEEDPDFPQLNETMRDAVNDVQFERESSLAVEPDEDEYQYVDREPRTLYKGKSDKANNPSGPYDIWDDLAYTKANISFGQLIQLAPSLRKQMREGTTVRRFRRAADQVQSIPEEDHNLQDNTAYYNAIEITVEIVDKMIPHTMVDDGSNTNIMPESTMRKLGLAITEPSFSTIKIADQGICKPIGRIRDLKVNTGGEEYTLTFEVLPMKGGHEEGSYPLLLGRGFLRSSKGVANWGATKPTFTYGPSNNRTKVEIHSAKSSTLSGKSVKPPVKNVEVINFISEDQAVNYKSIKCIGPGLYDFSDDGSLAKWLAENPYSDDELTVRFIEVSNSSFENEKVINDNPPEVGLRESDCHSIPVGSYPAVSGSFAMKPLPDPEEDSWSSLEIIDEESLGEEVNGLAILVDDITSEAFHLEIDGTQPDDWSAYLDEAIVANDLPPPLHFRRTANGIQVGHDLPIYPPVPNDWYHGPTDPVHVPPADWKEVNIAPPGEEPKNSRWGLNCPLRRL